MKRRKVATEKPKPTAQGKRDIPSSNRSRSLQKVEAESAVVVSQKYAKVVANAKKDIVQAAGVRDLKLSAVLIDQLSQQVALWGADRTSNSLEIAFETMLEMKPESVTEALLAVQMIGVHYAALSFLQRAAIPRQSSVDSDAGITRAISLMRLFNEQLVVMARLQGKSGKQRVVVKHVHVHQGGQAIVGAVTAPKRLQGGGGSGEKRTETP